MQSIDYIFRKVEADAEMQKKLDKFISRYNIDKIYRNGNINLIIPPHALIAFGTEFSAGDVINCKFIDGELNVDIRPLFNNLPEEYKVI